MSDKREAVERLRALLNSVLSATAEVRFDADDPQHVVAVALHGTVLEYAGGILELINADNTTAAFVVLRSALEALVDLSATGEDRRYPLTMQLEYLVQNRRVLNDALSDTTGNRYLQALGHHPDSQAKLAEFDRDIASLKAQGVQRLKIRQRFEAGDQLELYAGPYALLCRHSHNNLGILERRHLKRVEGRIEAEYFQAPSLHDVQLIVDTMAGLLANSIANLVALTTGVKPPALPEVSAKLAELRALWQSWPGA